MGAVKMDWALFWFVAICFVGTLIALQNFERLSVWVRGAWGAARGLIPSGNVLRKSRQEYAPAPANLKSQSGTSSAAAMSVITDAKPDKVGFKLHWGDVLAFLWKAKWALLILALFIAGMSLVGAFDFGKSKDTLRAERDAAFADKIVADHEADVATKAVELAEETHQDRVRTRSVVARAQEELADAASQDDFDRLHAVYRDRYLCLFDAGCESGSDPAPRGPDPVLSPRAHRA